MKMDGPGQGCTHSISKFLSPYPTSSFTSPCPIPVQEIQEIWFLKGGRRVGSPRSNSCLPFLIRPPAMLLRAPLARPFCPLALRRRFLESFFRVTHVF
jgi:hypothetical protein